MANKLTKTFLASDHHLGHLGVCKFSNKEGTGKLRPWDDPIEMTEAIIANHNQVVGEADKTIFLGDVVINRRFLSEIGRMNGRKILVRGNHDIFKTKEYLPYFEEIYGCYPHGIFMLTHIPMHPGSLRTFLNLHGHTHDRKVLLADGRVDPRYKCACMEQIEYRPVSLSHFMPPFLRTPDDIKTYIFLLNSFPIFNHVTQVTSPLRGNFSKSREITERCYFDLHQELQEMEVGQVKRLLHEIISQLLE